MTSGLKKIGLTPAKAALVAVLALVLAVVWGPQIFGSGSERPESVAEARPAVRSSSRAPRRGRRTTTQTPTTSEPARPAATERDLPTITLSDAAAYDPFAVPAWTSEAEQQLVAETSAQPASSSSLQQRFDSLKATGVGMVLVSGDGQAAQIGDRTVRVGDEIDGFRVIEITADNIVFQPAPVGEGDASDI